MSRQGVRTTWQEVPVPVRERIEAIAGARVVAATNLPGGFSPGPAARCDLADGRSVFVKAAGLASNPDTPGIHRREGRVLATMPAEVPAPRLIGVVDDGDWVALVIEWIDGRMPTPPLDTRDVERFLELIARVSDHDGHASLQPCAEANPHLWDHWKRLVDDPLPGLDTWTIERLDRFAEVETAARSTISGDRLVHLDLRTDNVLFATAGAEHDVAVDWPGACLGPPWVDLVCALPSLELDGGPTCEQALQGHRSAAGAEPQAVDTLIAAIAGYFTRMSLLPPPPGLPTVRDFQAVQGRVARRWLARRRGWDRR